MLSIQKLFLDNNDESSSRRYLHARGIQTVYTEDRILFHAQHNYKNSDLQYISEANGLILQRSTYKPLVVPPRTLRHNLDTNVVNRFLVSNFYTIYAAVDGTTVNLYYWNGRWTFSTAKGISMNDVKWHDLTYEEMFIQALETHGYTWETFLSMLDENYSYTFIMRHPSIHKFNNQQAHLYFVQYVNLATTSDKYLKVYNINTTLNIPTQDTIPYIEIKNMSTLYRKAVNALDHYKKTGEICYGFILRSVDILITQEHSDLYVESSLMKYIRKTWYDKDLINSCNKNNWNKEKIVTLTAFLVDKGKRSDFYTLFPQYRSMLTDYENLTNLLIDKVIQASNGELADTTDPLELEAKSVWEKIHSKWFLPADAPVEHKKEIAKSIIYNLNYVLTLYNF
jgi:hypothetical protein